MMGSSSEQLNQIVAGASLVGGIVALIGGIAGVATLFA